MERCIERANSNALGMVRRFLIGPVWPRLSRLLAAIFAGAEKGTGAVNPDFPGTKKIRAASS
jgi:hypothetical protein